MLKNYKPKSVLIILGVLVLGSASYGAYYWWPKNNKPVACTQEAKQCPDGSYVSRTGPNCEFAACPDITKDWKTYRNEEYGFELKYPTDWQITGSRQSGVMSIVSFRGVPGYAGDNLSVSFMPNQAGISIDEWWAEKSKSSNFKKTGEIKIAGQRALELRVLEMVLEPPGPEYIFTSQDRGGFIFQISTGGIPEDLINQILSTFKFTK